MILGIGTDLVHVERIRTVFKNHGQRFACRVYTNAERQKSTEKSDPVAFYARRFAAKEACLKALGTGFAGGVFLKDVEVLNLSGGKPTIDLTGGALRRLEAMLPRGTKACIHLTLTDDASFAQAFVVLEAQRVKKKFFLLKKNKTL